MKKILFILLLSLLGSFSYAFHGHGIDEKVIQLFQSNFPKAENVKWEEHPDSYAVVFTEGGINARINYARDGSSVNFTRQYNEHTLPYHIKFLVASRYTDRKIIEVLEVSNVSKEGYVNLSYYLVLEDTKTRWVIIIDGNGYTKSVEKMKRVWRFK